MSEGEEVRSHLKALGEASGVGYLGCVDDGGDVDRRA